MSASNRRTQLRVVPSEPRERLFDAGEGRRNAVKLASIGPGYKERPLGFIRVGPRDLPHALVAIAAGVSPTALVSGISESPDFTTRIHTACRSRGLPWTVDPLLFETALDGYKTRLHLQELEYTPAKGQRFTKAELKNRSKQRSLGRAVIGAQVELGVGALQTGAFLSSGLDDQYLQITRELAATGIAARDAWSNGPIIAQLPLRIAGFDTLERQKLLVNSLGRRQPDAYSLMLDGIHEDSSAERLASAIRLALLLRARGVPVVVARPGDLRRLFLSFGIEGIEFGLGRLLRFARPDYTRKGGQGPTRGPRFECPSLGASLPHVRARDVLERELVAEVDCLCRACGDAESVDERLERAPQHDAHAVDGQLGSLAGTHEPARVDSLDLDLRAASHAWAELERNGIRTGGRSRIERWLRAIEIVVEWGYLNRGHAEEALGRQ